MSGVLDKLRSFFAAASLHGTQLPHKPPAGMRKVRRSKYMGRRGAPCSQTRVVKLDVTTAQDIESSLVFVKNPVARALVEVLALPHDVSDASLRTALHGSVAALTARASKMRWTWLLEHPSVLKAVVAVTFKELQHDETCRTCHGHRSVLGPDGRWDVCDACGGTGMAPWGLRRRFPALKEVAQDPDFTEYRYKTAVAEAHSWLFCHLTHLLHEAWLTVRHARR